MVEVIHLEDDEHPPANERWLLIQWKPGEGSVTNHFEGQTTQLVPEHLWGYWINEAPALARRTGLARVYFKGRPDAQGATRAQ